MTRCHFERLSLDRPTAESDRENTDPGPMKKDHRAVWKPGTTQTRDLRDLTQIGYVRSSDERQKNTLGPRTANTDARDARALV